MKGNEMQKIGEFINKALVNHENETVLSSIKSEVREFCSVFPLFNVSK
jgi:glycine hydroxymethyltransferase